MAGVFHRTTLRRISGSCRRTYPHLGVPLLTWCACNFEEATFWSLRNCLGPEFLLRFFAAVSSNGALWTADASLNCHWNGLACRYRAVHPGSLCPNDNICTKCAHDHILHEDAFSGLRGWIYPEIHKNTSKCSRGTPHLQHVSSAPLSCRPQLPWIWCTYDRL